VVRALVGAGADINVQVLGMTALMLAHGHIELVRLLSPVPLTPSVSDVTPSVSDVTQMM
jgi:hypothetical protein